MDVKISTTPTPTTPNPFEQIHKFIAALLVVSNTRHLHISEKSHALMFLLKTIGEGLNNLSKVFIFSHFQTSIFRNVISARNQITHYYNSNIGCATLTKYCQFIGTTSNLALAGAFINPSQMNDFNSSVNGIISYFPTRQHQPEFLDLNDECYAINTIFSLMFDLDSFVANQDLEKIDTTSIKWYAIQNCVATLSIMLNSERRKILSLFSEENAVMLSKISAIRGSAIHTSYEFTKNQVIELVEFFQKTLKPHALGDLAALCSIIPQYPWHASAKSEAKKSLKDSKDLQEKVTTIEKRIAELKVENEIIINRNQQLTLEHNSINQALETSQTESKNIKTENQTLTSKVQKKKNKIKDLKTEKELHETKQRKLVQDNSKLKVENEDLKGKNVQLSTDIQNKQAEVDSKLQEITAKTKTIQTKNQEIATKNNEIKEKNIQLSKKDLEIKDKKTQIHKLESEKTQLSKDNGQKSKKINSLETEIKDHQLTNKRLSSANEQAQTNILELNQIVTTIKQENTQLIEANNSQKQIIQNHEDEIAKLREQIARLTADNSKKDEKIEKLEEKVGDKDKKIELLTAVADSSQKGEKTETLNEQTDGKNTTKPSIKNREAALSFEQKENVFPQRSSRRPFGAWNPKAPNQDVTKKTYRQST